VNCNKIYYKLYRNYIPTSQVFYFEATPIMVKYFNIIEEEKAKLSESYERVYLARDSEESKENKKSYIKTESEKIIRMFE
jgi:hypothetical protein